MNNRYAIGADIGGSHISALLINLESKKVEKDSLVSRPVDNKATAGKILETWALALKQIFETIDREELAGIGFAMPGPFDYENGIAHFTHEVAKYEKLNGVNVGYHMKQLLNLREDMPIRFMNDATSFAVGEVWAGKSSGFQRTIAITLGTGFGSAFTDSGIPVLERDDVPKLGCLWHLPFKEGIADDYFSTRWFIKRYAEETMETLPGVKEIAVRAATDNAAKRLFYEFGVNLGNFLGPWVRKFRAESIIIGGNMTGAWELFGPAFKLTLKQDDEQAAIIISELGETAAMVGSARLMDECFWASVKPLLSKM
jgi:glucokinase